MATISLTQGKVAIVDDDMYAPLMAMGKWQYRTKDGYAGRNAPRPQRRSILMHRVVMELAGFDIDGKRVDHRHGDRLDNRQAELRIATHSQNLLNHQSPPRGKSGYYGVCHHKESGLWHAYITVDKTTHSLGYFHEASDAARAYDHAARVHCGEYAAQNFPGELEPQPTRSVHNRCSHKPGKNNTSGFKGVCWDKARQLWVASMRIDGKSKQIGRFSDAEQAARAYDKAALEHWGELAWLNFPRDIVR